ncbi:hypothetical protein E2C01_050594 [Portunus trituberculatus]|uniref:Uncharacterized protein n=1 Tax=Portunus trituberculatus TaxID=210409 RepID=A0A5B7GHY8_PORTR|nr:hypothetical protein [Portunus trituberculatus]
MDHADRTGGGVPRGGVWTVLQDANMYVFRSGDECLTVNKDSAYDYDETSKFGTYGDSTRAFSFFRCLLVHYTLLFSGDI